MANAKFLNVLLTESRERESFSRTKEEEQRIRFEINFFAKETK
jgi:hypothetical protein